MAVGSTFKNSAEGSLDFSSCMAEVCGNNTGNYFKQVLEIDRNPALDNSII